MKKTNIITEGALFSGIYLLLLLMTVFLPALGTVTMFLLPIPIILYTYKHGLKSAFVMFIVISILTVIFATILSLPITILSGIGGIAIGLCLHYKRSVYETWAAGSVAYALGFIIVFVMFKVFFEVNLINEMNQMMEETSQQMISIVEQYGNFPEETIQLFEEQMLSMTYLIPAIIGLVGVIFSLLSLWLGFKLINRLYHEDRKFPPFYKFSLPISLVWYYLISFILIWIEPDQNSLINQAASNVSMLIGMLLVLQGLAFIAYYVFTKQKSKGLLIAAIVLLILMPTLFIYPIRILGIIDLGFNLRERMSNEK